MSVRLMTPEQWEIMQSLSQFTTFNTPLMLDNFISIHAPSRGENQMRPTREDLTESEAHYVIELLREERFYRGIK